MTVSGATDGQWVLEWSLGPVQAFVTAARRTRDLWGGSYLLSLLVAKAIAAAGLSAEAFEVPVPGVVRDDPLVVAWRSPGTRVVASEELPPTASLPNHVRVRIGSAEPQATAEKTAEKMHGAVQELWQKLADGVWQRYLSNAERAGKGTRDIWDRQVGAFWEVTWVAGPPPKMGSPSLLARRKLWRSHLLPEEPGDRCMVMPEWQELSGFVRARGERQAQEGFWDGVRKATGDLEVRPDERLSAPAMIKRLWPTVAEHVVPGVPDVKRWPSTWHFALAPWLGRVIEADEQAATGYCGQVSRLLRGRYAQRTRPPLPCTRIHAIWGVDPELLYPSGVRASGPEELTQSYEKLCEKVGGRPSPYFAVVVADGDRLGRLVGQHDSRNIGAGLASFAEKAREVAKEHCSVLVYAGGDDVLAFAPLGEALGFADDLAKTYQECLKVEGVKAATMSAAVVFAHAKAPLSETLSTARQLLDAEAKERNGRASLAVAVAKGLLKSAQWVSGFDGGAKAARSVERLSRLVDAWRPGPGALSCSALYRVAELARRYSGVGEAGFTGQGGPAGATGGGRSAEGVLHALFANELARTQEVTGTGVSTLEAWQKAGELLWCMGRHPGPDGTGVLAGSGGDGPAPPVREAYIPLEHQLGVLDLVRFLSAGGEAEQ